MKDGGVPVNRQWVLVTHSGAVIIDWGDETFQDVHSGDFIKVTEEEISHHIQNEELEVLKRAGKVAEYDAKVISFYNLPERRQKTIE
ncbi:MAG: hypothetical protein ABSE06_20995 [Anaerolineaceae bacterium]|jgi:hypothetical protein